MRLGLVADYCERDLRMIRMESAQSGGIGPRDAPGRLDLESFSRPPVFLDEQVDLGAGVGPPEKQARFAPQIGSHAQSLEDHELLEKPAAQGGVRERCFSIKPTRD